MKTQSLRRFTLLLTLAAGVLSARNVPTLNAQTIAAPGTVNYIEGSVSIDGTPLNGSQIRQVALQRNQTLSTGNGKAEVLMSPGAFLRIGANSEVRMIAPELVNPQVEVARGSAMLEVDSKVKDASLTVSVRDASVSVLKQGLYRFDSDQASVAVIDGKLNVSENGHSKEIGKGKEIILDNEPELKAVSFDRKAKDDLYVWSEIRSGSLAEANASTAEYLYSGYGPYRGGGWYWNPSFAMYSWLPGDGFFYSPFGYPFYSVGYVPFYGGFYGPRHGGFVPRRPLGMGFARPGNVSPHAPAPVRGMSGTPRFSGGGFRGVGGFRGGVHGR